MALLFSTFSPSCNNERARGAVVGTTVRYAYYTLIIIRLSLLSLQDLSYTKL